MYPNPLKQRIRNGELLLGTVLTAPSAMNAAMICRSGIDFMWIDTEHGPFNVEMLDTIPVIARQNGVAPVIRVAWNDPALIKKAYDSGAVAVMVPQVNTPEEAKQAVQYAYYPPLGQRGVSPWWPFTAGEDWINVIKTANEEIVVVLQLESVEAYNNLDVIKTIPGIDVLFVGPMDLSASVGKITDMKSPEVQAMMREVPRRLEGTGIMTGTTLSDPAELKEKMGWGYRFLNVGNPLSYGIQALQGHLAMLRQ